MNSLEKARGRVRKSMEAGIEESITNAEIIHLRDAIRWILSHLEAQEAAKPVEPVEWREGDLVRWEKGSMSVVGILVANNDPDEPIDEGGHLGMKVDNVNDGFLFPAAECTLIKRAGE